MPPGVWFRCAEPSDAALVATIEDGLADAGTDVRVVTTGMEGAPNPSSRREARHLIERQGIRVLVWIGGALDLGYLQAAREAGVAVLLVNLSADALDGLSGFWMRGRLRVVLSGVAGLFVRDRDTAEPFRAAGVPADAIHAGAALEPAVEVLGYTESDRRDIAEALQSRPVWMATGVRMQDVEPLATAQRQATRRAHRLLLVAEPADPAEGPAIARAFTDGAGLLAGCASDDPYPQDAALVHVADAECDLGLWLRLASVTLAGGTFDDAPAVDPFVIAALGSGLLHGPRTEPFADRYARLAQAGATRSVPGWEALGLAVEDLLAADRVAVMVTAGWDVTSRGAQSVQTICETVLASLSKRAA